MDRSKNIVLLGFCVLVLNGCAAMSTCGESGEVRLFRTPTEYMVNSGIKNYEDGNYPASITVLQSLVESKEATKGEKLLAYKYLAFDHCVSPRESKELREKMCRDSFRKAFDFDPKFILTPAEAGHPIWGPIFSSEKNKLSK